MKIKVRQISQGVEDLTWRNMVPPQDPKDALGMREYINKHMDTWKKLEQEHNLKKGVADSDLTFPGFEVNVILPSDR